MADFIGPAAQQVIEDQQAQLIAAQERIAELERTADKARALHHEMLTERNRIVEAGDALADAVDGAHVSFDRERAELRHLAAAYREAVGGEPTPKHEGSNPGGQAGFAADPDRTWGDPA